MWLSHVDFVGNYEDLINWEMRLAALGQSCEERRSGQRSVRRVTLHPMPVYSYTPPPPPLADNLISQRVELSAGSHLYS